MNTLTVKDVMTRDVASISSELTVDIALQTMREHEVRRLPVVGENDRLMGIITLMDAAVAMPRGSTYFSASPLEDVPTVRETMTANVITIGPDEPVVAAARLMLSNDIGALPVVEALKVVGIVTESDLFKTLVDVLDRAPAK